MIDKRKDVRTHFAGLLATALSSLVSNVYAYRKADFNGASPVVVVSSGGSEAATMTFQGNRPGHYITVFVFVRYAFGAGWTEEDCEDRLDDIGEVIQETVSANQVSNYWQSITQAGKSETYGVTIGVEYRAEAFLFKFE